MKTKMRKFLLLTRDFGPFFAIKYYLLRESKNYDKHIKLVYDKLLKELENKVEEYKRINYIPRGEKSKNIWVCWWQGYEQMPLLCKLCYEQLKKIIPPEYKLVLITSDNYMNYVNIPDYITDKLGDGSLSVTQFSDILREALIYYNGGTWIDASVWTNEKIIDFLELDLSFWSVKLQEIDDREVWGQLISECKWAGFLLSGEKGNLVCKFAYECMCLYFKNHVSTIDYFIQNLILKIGYDQVPVIREIIDRVPVSNTHLYELYRHMNDEFCEEIWNDISSDTGAFKLTQKRQYKIENNGKKTFYGFLRAKYPNIQ